MSKEKALKTLGLAYSIRKCAVGEEQSLLSIQNKKSSLVLLASDAGVNTTKRVTDKSKSYGVPVIRMFSSLELSHALGKENRMVVSIDSRDFAKLIQEALQENA